jgi:signal recognition particle subunit SRP54
MYRSLTQKLSSIFSKYRHGQIQDSDIEKALSEIKSALIEADVSLQAIDAFSTHVQTHTKTLDKVKGLDTQSQLMEHIRSALLTLLQHDTPLPNFQNSQLQTILLVGLQGAGKTTTCGKLAQYIHNNGKKNIMMASVDIYRPAAIEQLKIIANQSNTNFHPHHEGQSPLQIAQNALDHAKRTNMDILIIDTAGRLDIDVEKMNELQSIHQAIKPQHTFYVVDSMMGQSALQTAKTFNENVDITGIILSKTDSDAKGGVALSIKTVIKQPIFWVGTGEALSQLEPFNPERIANQLLDMGDIIGLAEKAQKYMDEKKTKAMSKRLHQGQFSLDDMLMQIEQISNMGGMLSVLKMMPGAAKIPDNILKMVEDDRSIKSIKYLLQSMTRNERHNPNLIRNQKSRQQRVIKGSGRNKAELNELLKSYDKMKKMADKLKGGKMKAMMKQLMQSGQLPPNQ